MISTHAIVDAEAKLGRDVHVGHFSVIGKGVVIGDGCKIGTHVVIHPDTQIAENVRIDDHAVVGKSPMQAANSATTTLAALPPAKIAAGCIIGTGAIVYRGADLASRALVADLACVRERVTIGERTIIGWGAYVECDCTVGNFVKMESGAYLTAYSAVEDYCFIAPGVVTSNDNFVGRTRERFGKFKGVTVKRGARIGAGATILPGKVVEAEALVAAGSVLTKNAPSGKVLVGTPARVLRDVPKEQLYDSGNHTKS